MAQQVLVVEDDEDNREAVRYILEDAGYAVAEAVDGRAALEMLRASPDGLVVVLDLLLPVLDGAGMLAALEDGAPGAEGAARHAFILVTASPRWITPELAERLARLEAPVVAKPFEVADLVQEVAAAALRVGDRGCPHPHPSPSAAGEGPGAGRPRR